MKPEIFADRVLAWLGPVPMTRTMLTSAATSLLLVALFEHRPRHRHGSEPGEHPIGEDLGLHRSLR